MRLSYVKSLDVICNKIKGNIEESNGNIYFTLISTYKYSRI